MKIAILGAAGMQASAIYYDLIHQDDVEIIYLVDTNLEEVDKLIRRYPSSKATMWFANAASSLAAIFRRCDVAISCLPYNFNYAKAAEAIENKCSYVDLGGNNKEVEAELSLDQHARAAGVLVVPDCGLAPGIPSMITAQIVEDFDEVDSIDIKCGGVPQPAYKNTLLNYSLVFSAEGLLNEYLEDTLIIDEGQTKLVPSLTGLEKLTHHILGPCEAAYTSGGISTLVSSFKGRIRNLRYKTVRYPGHFEFFRILSVLGAWETKGFRENFTALLKSKLDTKLPDVVVLEIDVRATRGEVKCRRVYEAAIYPEGGLTAMARATGFSASAVALIIGRGQAKTKTKAGAVPQELCIPPGLFIDELKNKGIDIRCARMTVCE